MYAVTLTKHVFYVRRHVDIELHVVCQLHVDILRPSLYVIHVKVTVRFVGKIFISRWQKFSHAIMKVLEQN